MAWRWTVTKLLPEKKWLKHQLPLIGHNELIISYVFFSYAAMNDECFAEQTQLHNQTTGITILTWYQWRMAP